VVKRSIGIGLALLSALCALACGQILGIEDARVDASLEEGAAQAGTNAQQTSGGSAGSSAAPAGSGAETSEAHMNHGSGAGPGGSNGSEPSDEGSAGAPGEPTLCERYCEVVTTNCKGKYEQYRTFDQCVEVCKRLPPGEAEDDDVNTVSCRVRQAEFAESEPFVYCNSAGPLGAGRCGSNCSSYCALMQTTCTADSTLGNLELSYFDSSQACMAACSALPSDADDPQQYSSSATAEPSSFVGNNVYCRTYHVTAALEQNTPDEHCPHAMGGDPCID
jgi:hypothetical protein